MSLQPTLYIEGEAIDATWNGSDVVAIADISLDWGRDDIYAPTEPLQFDISLIDPTGQWATDAALSGQEVLITRPGSVVVMRGTIADIDSTWTHVQNPLGYRQAVWVVHLSGTCKLADLAQARIAGPGYFLSSTHIPGGWIQAKAANRAALLLSRGASDIVSAIETIPIKTALGQPTPVNDFPLQFIDPDAAERMSALDHIKRIYSCYPLAHVNYNPGTNAIEIGATSATAGFSLTLDGGMIVMDPLAGLTVDSTTVEVPEGYTVKSTVSQAIDTVQAGLGIFASDEWIEASVQGTTARGLTSRTGRTLELDTRFRDEGTASNNTPGTVWANALIALTIALVDDINDRFSPPVARFDLRRFDYPPELVDIILDTKDRTTPLFFASSVFANLPNFPAQFQLIGGRLQWIGAGPGDRLGPGWVLDATLVPATGTLDPVTIANLVTNTGPALEDYDPAISLADLGNVTLGLS